MDMTKERREAKRSEGEDEGEERRRKKKLPFHVT
jgi:hypothetical protein